MGGWTWFWAKAQRPRKSRFKRWARPKNVDGSKNTWGIKGNSPEQVPWRSKLATITETLIWGNKRGLSFDEYVGNHGQPILFLIWDVTTIRFASRNALKGWESQRQSPSN